MKYLRWTKKGELCFYDKRLWIARDHYNLFVHDTYHMVTDVTIQSATIAAVKALAKRPRLYSLKKIKDGCWIGYMFDRYFPGSVTTSNQVLYPFRCKSHAIQKMEYYERKARRFLETISDYRIVTQQEQEKMDEERARAYRSGNVSHVALS